VDRLALGIGVVVVAAVAAVAGWLLLSRERLDPQGQAEATAAAWASAVAEARFEDLPMLAAGGEVEVAAYRTMWDELGVTDAAVSSTVDPVTRAEARATLDVTLTLGQLGTFSYPVDLQMIEPGEGWLVAWEPATLHPRYREGWSWSVETEDVPRAPILDRDGEPLTEPGEIAIIGIHPGRVVDEDEVASVLSQHTQATREEVEELFARDDLQADWFYPVVEVRDRQRYAEVRSILFPVPGIVFRSRPARLTPTEGFATHILGRTGEITAELLEEYGAPYQPGDSVGLSGLERAFERQLAGRPDTTIHLVDGSGDRRAQVATFQGIAPEPVQVTLDRRVQSAAEEALDGVDGVDVGALVAVDTRTGDILASANRPVGGFNRALTGLYPPGSTFKVVTAAAAVAAGATLTTQVDCPAETIVGGLRVTNLGGFELGTVPLETAFARSCNTTFAELAADLGADLDAVAGQFGFDVGYELAPDGARDPDAASVPVAGGRFPEPQDLAERAAAAFGQARVQASPLHLATVAAAVANGTWRAPRLLVEAQEGATRALPAGSAGTLRALMRAAIVAGTGAAADVPGEPAVHGKTGSAETADPAVTHAWFIGFRGAVAFAVLVEGGGSGGEVAAPVAARFLEALAG